MRNTKSINKYSIREVEMIMHKDLQIVADGGVAEGPAQVPDDGASVTE